MQCTVVPGFLIHALLYRLWKDRRIYLFSVETAIVLCCIGAETMLFAPCDSLFYLILTGITVFLLGFFGGAVYLKLSRMIGEALHSGLCIGIGYAFAVAMQFCFQLQWTVRPVLSILLVLSSIGIICIVRKNDGEEPSLPQERLTIRPQKPAAFAVITFTLLLFTTYYNSYIHHLQVASGYTEYNAYSWPRLLMIPTILAFGLLSDVRGGRYLPIGTLCISVFAFLNTMLLGRETYRMNMCLYYIVITAAIAFYHLTFLRLAQNTARPALWACMGRILDSVNVIVGFAFRFSEKSPVTVLLINIVSIIVVIVLMAVSGEFGFAPHGPEQLPSQAASAPFPSTAAPQTQDAQAHPADVIPAIGERYALTPKECAVLRELVCTEEKQEAIAERLGMSVNTLRHHVTALYKKTDTETRAGLCSLYHTFQ